MEINGDVIDFSSLPAMNNMHLKMSTEGLISVYRQQCGPISDCSSRSSLIRVLMVCYRDILNGLADDTEYDISSWRVRNDGSCSV